MNQANALPGGQDAVFDISLDTTEIGGGFAKLADLERIGENVVFLRSLVARVVIINQTARLAAMGAGHDGSG